MPSQIVQAGDSVVHSLISSFTTFMNFIPTLIGALVVLLIGWWISAGIGKLVEKGLWRVGLDRAATRVGVSEPISHMGVGWTVSHLFGVLTKWFVRLIFVLAAANVLNMPQITAIINEIVLFIPKLAVGLVILMIGVWAGNLVSELVHKSVSAAGIERPGIFALIARYSILGIAIIAAASQIGIAPVIVNTLFMALVGALALAFGLAFGLGGKDVAGEISRNWYASGKTAAEKLRVVRERRESELPPTGS